MNVQISTKNLTLTDALADHVQRKLDKLDRYLPHISETRVDLARQTFRSEDHAIAQITLRHRRGAILRAEARQPGEIAEAVNAAVDKLYRQIERFKGKRLNRRGRERFSASADELALAEALPDEADTALGAPGATPDDAEQVLRRKMVALEPMDEQEAIEQMELLGHTFFLFQNANTGALNVVYKRRTHGYGLLVPGR